MAYVPRPFTAELNPETLKKYLEDELTAISKELTETAAVDLRTVHVAPSKPREGMIVAADGTDWNPGNGAGTYAYLNGAWNYLGYVAPPDLTPYLTKADNLNSVANKATSRSNLGVAIGTDVLAYDAQLTSNIRQNTQNASYTLVAADAEKHIYASSGAGTAWIIPSNASVPYPIGTVLTFVNSSGNNISLQINTDTLIWSPSGATGTRTLAFYAVATAIKVTNNAWFLTGSGIS